MACNCNTTQKICGCQQPTCTPIECGCPVYLTSDCVNNVKAVFECSEIETGLSLTETLEQLDAFICTKFNSVTNYFALVNVGGGVQVYKGVNGIGQKEIRTLSSLNTILTLNQATNEIQFDIDEEVLSDFIQDQIDVQVSNQNGTGASVLRDVVESPTGTFTIRGKKIKSDSLSITETDTEISIESPDSISGAVAGFFINNAYEPSYSDWVNAGGDLTTNPSFVYKGDGSLAKPYTDSVRYTSPTVKVTTSNTSIQNGLDAYNNDGTLITIQNNGSSYIFSGNFNYPQLNIKLDAGTQVNSTTTGFLVDMTDSAFDPDSDTVTITVELGAILKINGNGFKNNGNTQSGTTYATGKIVYLKGENGVIYSDINDPTKYLINSDTSNSGNNNDGNLTFEIRTKLRADYQGVYNVGGVSRVDIYNTLISGTLTNTVNTTLKAFHQTGGQVRMFNTSVEFTGTTRDSAITFEPNTIFEPTYIAINTSFTGTATNLFEKLNTSVVNLQVIGSNSAYALELTEVFESPNIWDVEFNSNNIYLGNIDITKADLTKGNTINATNFVNGFLIESLRTFSSKESARLSLLPKGSAYILSRDVNATDLQPNTEYKVKTAGSPSLGTVGSYFIATGSETGTGVATLIERCTMQ